MSAPVSVLDQSRQASGQSAARPKVLFICHDLDPNGGDRVVAAWMLQALAPLYDVTILTWAQPDLAALDKAFGTAISGLPFEVRTPSRAMGWLIERIPDDSSHQRANYLVRLAKQQRHEFDAIVSCTFEAEVGQPAIQYIHYPYIARKARVWTVPGDSGPADLLRGLLSGRTRPWMLISGYSFERLRSNRTFCNSEWTSRELASQFGISSGVLYPPAPGHFPDTPWEARRNAFIAIGRLHPVKRQDWIIETLAQVRPEIHDLELHICGFADRRDYLERLQELAAAHGPWVQIHQNLSRNDISSLLGQCRYGIHAMVEEHFGIAPAEMARAGCIPFVHASGGQVEIIDRDARLCFASAEEAARKILAVMRDSAMQQAICSAVLQRSERFTPAVFVGEFQRIVAEFLSSRKRAAAL